MNQRKWIVRNVALTGCVGILATMVACSDDTTTPVGPGDGSTPQEAAVHDSAPADTYTADTNVGNDVVAEDGGTVDGSSGDSNATDTGAADTGTTDTAVVDTGVVDTGVVDTGVVDTGVVDTGVVDTGVVDTGVRDTSVRDTGVTDTSVTDTSVADTSVADTSVADSGAADTSAADTSAGDSAGKDGSSAVDANPGDAVSGDGALQPPAPLDMCALMDSFWYGQRLGGNGWPSIIAAGPLVGNPGYGYAGYTNAVLGDCEVLWIANAADPVAWGNDVTSFTEAFFGCPPDAGMPARAFPLVPKEIYGQPLNSADLRELGDWYVESINWAVTNQALTNPEALLTVDQLMQIEALIVYDESLYSPTIASNAFSNSQCADAGANDAGGD
jgi:hypothetical protein